jgi:hypothetical protein
VLSRIVPLEIPGAGEPVAAAVDWAAPLGPGLAGVVETEEGVGLGEAERRAAESGA